MIKFTKTLFLQIIVFLLFINTQGFTKSLPPGSGEGDIPANVLIMLDKSGSMSRAAGGTGTGVDTKRPGKLAVGSTVADSGRNVFYNAIYSNYDKRNIAYDNSLTWKWKKTSPCKYNSVTEVAEYYDGHFYFVNAAGQYCKVNQTTGLVTKIKTYSSNNFDITGGDLNGRFLYLYNGKWWKESIIIRDLSTGTEKNCPYNWTTDKLGYFIGNWSSYTHGTPEINRSGEYMLLYSYSPGGKKGFFKFKVNSELNCPGDTYTAYIPYDYKQYSAIRHIESSTLDDDHFYVANDRSHKVQRLDFSDNTLSAKDIVDIGKKGKIGASYGPTSRSDVTFKNPRSIATDSTNNRIYVSDVFNDCIQVFDEKSDGLDFAKMLGCKMKKTRMTGAHEAIKAITTDDNLISGVHFGFAYWSYSYPVRVYSRWVTQYPKCTSIKATLVSKYKASHNITNSHWMFGTQWWRNYRCKDVGGSYGYTGWDDAKNQATPCDNDGCLKVKIDKEGSEETAKVVTTVTPGGGTDAGMFTKIALDYFKHADSPRDSSLSCQINYIIVIGDGVWINHKKALQEITTLKNTYGVKTITVAYGGGINASGIANFREAAIAGGTEDVIIANDAASLKTSLSAEINRILAERVSFTPPAIRAKIEGDGAILQAQFKYVQNQEWRGQLKKTKLNASGGVKKDSKGNPIIEWQAEQNLPDPDKRKIWSAIAGTDYVGENYNNVVTSNRDAISNLFTLFGGSIPNYHSATPNVPGTVGTTRCKNAALFGPTNNVDDTVNDDTEGLITFLRGLDYFDYDGDCNLKEKRTDSNNENIYLGDIYHSEMIIVGPPSAETNFSSDKEEAYWRALKKYDADMTAGAPKNRDEIVYVGTNSGMLHAFNFETGVEKWAFIPPFLFPKLPTIINPNLNSSTSKVKGGSNAIFGVDGSPVQHDIFFQSPYDSTATWHTILIIPYGRGGNGFSVIIVTDPNKPQHLFSVYNDVVEHKVHVMKHDGSMEGPYEYIAKSYNLEGSEEASNVQEKYEADPENIDPTCDDTQNTSCYKSKIYTIENFPVNGLTKSDFSITINGEKHDNFTVTNNLSTLVITFGKDVYYQANPQLNPKSDQVGIFINSSSAQTGVLSPNEHYDYSQLGATWSAPRVLRVPNQGPGDVNIEDDLYVAVMGAGFGAKYQGVGSGVYVINLTDPDNPGRIEKFIQIEDKPNNGIVNSVPGDPVVISTDSVKGYVNYRGAIVYVSDLEGKITKINLTDLLEPGLQLYDNYTLFDVKSTSSDGRLMYHSMEAAMGKDTKNLWLFGGTGDFLNLTDTSSPLTKNVMFGISDKSFPSFNMPPPSLSGPTPVIDDLTKCSDTTKDNLGAKCPHKLPSGVAQKIGWYIELDNYKKVTASPTIAGGIVYFPVFTPPLGADKCQNGIATICAVDDECGTNESSQLGANPSKISNEDCHYVGTGILSKIVAFGGQLYANIAGESESGSDLITKDAIGDEVDISRGTWKENF